MEWNDEIKKLVIQQQEQIKEKNVKILRCLFSSLNGEFYCMEENSSTYTDICESGVGIDGSSIPGFAKTENSDLLLRGDPQTFQFVDCEGECAEVVCCAINLERNSFHPGCPRGILLNVLKNIKERNICRVTQFGELEFFLVDPITQQPYDLASYCSLPPIDKSTKFRHELVCVFLKEFE
jgi:glutamine synthetase